MSVGDVCVFCKEGTIGVVNDKGNKLCFTCVIDIKKYELFPLPTEEENEI